MFTVGNDIVVFDQEGYIVVRIIDPLIARAAATLPYAQVMQNDGQILVSLPWCEDSCRMFQNIGIDTTGAAPFFSAGKPLIEGKYPPMDHQLFTAAFVTLNPRCYVLNDPRTGKTGSLILAMDYLQRQRFVTGAYLVITTVTTMPDVWVDAIKTTIPGSVVAIAHGPKREKILEVPANFYVTNYDSVRLSLPVFKRAVLDGRIGGIVIDELTHVGNLSSQRHKRINELVNNLNVRFVVGATGSPGGKPEATFGMCRIINPGKLPCTTKGAWMKMVTYQYGPEPFMRRLTAQAPAIIHAAMQPAIRFAKADVIKNLPPITFQNRRCVLSPEQLKVRNQLKIEAMALLQSGETITAANGGVNHQKLMQVAQGFIIDNLGNVIYLDHKDRTHTIIEAIEESNRKVVVFGIYKAALRNIADEIAAAGITVELIDGSVNGRQRAKILHDFQYEQTLRVLVAQATTCSYGVELSAADTMIFQTPPLLGTHLYTQILERLSSSKQQADNINIIRVISTPEEEKAYKQLDEGQTNSQIVAALFEDLRGGNI